MEEITEEDGVEMKLVPLPVADVDRALDFYVAQLGFTLDVDVRPAERVRVAQLTPPGSARSIGLGSGLAAHQGRPGSVRALHLVVADIEAAHARLVERGVEVGQVDEVGGGVRHAGPTDPDGNTWVLQQMPWRIGADF